VTQTPATDTSYRLAPALAARLVGRSLVTLAVLVVVATVVGQAIGAGWVVPVAIALVGVLLVAGWAWWLLRRASAVRLTDEGYDVRLLHGIGVVRAIWTQVEEATAASPQGEPCLVIRLRDGRVTRLPMAALAGDRDAFARDVRRRLREAHSADRDDDRDNVRDKDRDGDGDGGADSVGAEDSL
jgi:hypothetical protein